MAEMTEYQKYIALSRYARWLPKEKRRENWDETVNRYLDYFTLDLKEPDGSAIVGAGLRNDLFSTISSLEVMPSMRALMTAGTPLERDHVAGYNCAYVAVDSPRVFDETMYILMCGTGVGFSVERQYINLLPPVAEEFHNTDTTIVVRDSKIGWAKAYRELIAMLYNGQIPKWDVSLVRKAGAPLKTFGGRASGPDPLVSLFKLSTEVFRNAAGRKLTSIECHDLMCKVADVVVVGGVRRSALISLSNLTDDRMRHAKSGQWWVENPQRALANNSICYTEKPDMQAFMREWLALVESGSGERGIFYRGAAETLVPERRKAYGYKDYGCNPCSEIVLRSKQFCNLSEVVVRPHDTYNDLRRKVKHAAILGTLQATKTKFRYLSSEWRRNTEEEALLGVSFTGIMDHPVLSGRDISGTWFDHPYTVSSLGEVLEGLRDYAVEVNKEWAAKLGINPATAVTAVKPSGTVSQLVDSASGIHPRFAPYYVRTIRADKKDPLAKLMVAQGFPVEDDVMKPDTGYVFSFPQKAPIGSVTVSQVDAISQLELWKTIQLHWCEHKPSITVYVKDDEWLKVGAWVYEHFDIVSGISFLPHTNHTYQQAPYQECTEEEYLSLKASIPVGDFSLLKDYEEEDNTIGMKEYACTGNACEVV